MTTERKKALRTLAKLMNQQNISPTPVTNELLDCFDAVISPEETAFLSSLGPDGHSYAEAASLSDLPEDAFATFFDGLLKKGLVWAELSHEQGERFRLAPILVGWFEIYLSDGQETPEKKEFARRVDAYFLSLKRVSLFAARFQSKQSAEPASGELPTTAPEPSAASSGTVRIDVNRTVPAPATKIYPSQNILDLIEQYGDTHQIALMHCFCRQLRKMTDEPCRFDLPAEACIVIGQHSHYIVNYGIGRYISKAEALEVVHNARRHGAVHQVFHEHEDINRPEIGICNCCWDCCCTLSSFNRGLLPLRVRSYALAQVTAPLNCIACEACVHYCPTHAIDMRDNIARIDTAKCIGCGQCELQCPQQVISMSALEREVILGLQNTREELFTKSPTGSKS